MERSQDWLDEARGDLPHARPRLGHRRTSVTREGRPTVSSSMRKKSSGSVRVFYPKIEREELIARLRERVRALNDRMPLGKAVLFRSHATGRHTVASDVDVLVVYAGDRRDDAFQISKWVLDSLGVEPHVYSEAEYRELRETIDRMVQAGIGLLGNRPPGKGAGARERRSPAANAQRETSQVKEREPGRARRAFTHAAVRSGDARRRDASPSQQANENASGQGGRRAPTDAYR